MHHPTIGGHHENAFAWLTLLLLCLSPIFALVILSFYVGPLLSLAKRKLIPDDPYRHIPKPVIKADKVDGAVASIN
jgi:hypothetical protein